MHIGLDIGTSGTKAALVGTDGSVAGSFQVSYGFADTADGHRALDAGEVWEAVKTCLEALGSLGEVETITVSTLGEAVIPMDRAGEPLALSITGTDRRGICETAALEETVGLMHLIDITGLNPTSIYSAGKLVWMKREMPELYEAAWKIPLFQDYVIYRLCGRAVIDYSSASRTQLFDIGTMDWSEELLGKTGIDREKLSRPVPAGTVAGTIRKELAEELGLSAAARIVAGTHDHICNALGSGVFEVGSCANTVGTTEGLTAVLRREQLSSEYVNRYQISCEPFVRPGLFNTVAWENTSGVLLRWFAEEFMREEPAGELIATFEKLNGRMKREPTKLLVLPHFSGAASPYGDGRSKGAILGLTLDTEREDIYKALMEGANMELALILEGLTKAGLAVGHLVSTGGALSPQLLQIKADVLGIPIHTVESRQTGALGGAILGAVAAGAYGDVKEAVSAMVRTGKTYEPDPGRSRIYKERLALYRQIYPAIAGISHGLGE